jgi:transposase-like protein
VERARIQHERYSKEFWEDAVRLVTEGGLAAGEASARHSLPKSTLENSVRAAKKGKLGEIGKSHRPLSELEMELAQVKRELAIVKVEPNVLKRAFSVP